MKKNYNFINKYKIELIVILILILISICIYYFYKKYNSYENFTATIPITKNDWTQIGTSIYGHKPIPGQPKRSIALSSDGKIVAIGGIGTNKRGNVSIYQWLDGKWDQLGISINGEADNDYSSGSVALSSDGKIVAIGATNNDGNGLSSGHVRIYQWDDTKKSWDQLGLDIDGEATNDYSGGSVALSSDGKIVAISAPHNDGNGEDSGNVRIFQWNETETEKKWKQLGLAIGGENPSDYSGQSVALSSDGKIVAIGAIQNDGNGSDSGHVRIFQWNDDNKKWEQLGIDIDGEAAYDMSGFSVALSSNGMIVAIGAKYNAANNDYSNIYYGYGHVRIHQWNENDKKWEQLGLDIDGEEINDEFGNSIALSSDGKIVAIGYKNSKGNRNLDYTGRVQIYKWNNIKWEQLGKNIEPTKFEGLFGYSVALSSDGNIVAIATTGDTYEPSCVKMYTYYIHCEGSFVNDSVCIPSNDLNLNCGPGTQTQKYVITQPASNGGNQCVFIENQPLDVACNLLPCPIDCVGSFGEYSDCTKSCAGGKKERVYTITQSSQYGGKQCPNNDGYKEVTDCNTQACPIPCEGEFVDFKPCSKECGTDGILLQQYKITKPAQYGGLECPNEQNDVKSVPCNRKPCPTYPENTAIKEALKESNNKIQNIRYDIINRQEDLDLLTNKFNRLNKNISFLKNNTNYVPDDKTLKFY